MTITNNEDLRSKLEQALIAEDKPIGLSLFRAMDSLGLKLRLHDSETKYDAPEKTIYISNNLIDDYSLQRGFNAAIAGLFNHEFEHHFDVARTVARYNDALAIDSRAYSKHLFYANEADALFDQFMKKTDYGLNYGNVSNSEIQLVKQELQAALDRRDINWSAFEVALKANIASKLEAAGYSQAAAEDYANAVDRHHGRPIAPRTGEEVRYFQDRYEQNDITEAMYRVANLTEADIREIAAYEGLASLMTGATLNLDFSNFGSEVNSEDEYTISVPSLANLVRAGMTVQEAVTSTLMGQLGTSLMAGGFFGDGAAFDTASFNNAIDSGNLSGFMDGLSQLEARSYFSQYYIKESLGLDVPIVNALGEDLTATLNELIPGAVESALDSVGGAIGALASELRASMDVDKSGLMLNGSRDAFSPYRSQLTADFKYLPREIMLAMADPFETDYFPSADVLALDEQDDYEYPAPWDYRVYIDGVIRDVGAVPAHEPWSHKRYAPGPDPINRLTVFVNGELYIDEYYDLSDYPMSAIGAEAVFSWHWKHAGNWWDFEPPPLYYQPRTSSNFSVEAILDTMGELATPSPTQSSATQLVQAMSEMGSVGTAPSFNIVRRDEPLSLAAN